MPAQMEAGVLALASLPDAHQNEGYDFRQGGLVHRLQVATVEGMETTLRALLAVGQYSSCRLSDEVRIGYFNLLSAQIPPLDTLPPFECKVK